MDPAEENTVLARSASAWLRRKRSGENEEGIVGRLVGFAAGFGRDRGLLWAFLVSAYVAVFVYSFVAAPASSWFSAPFAWLVGLLVGPLVAGAGVRPVVIGAVVWLPRIVNGVAVYSEGRAVGGRVFTAANVEDYCTAFWLIGLAALSMAAGGRGLVRIAGAAALTFTVNLVRVMATLTLLAYSSGLAFFAHDFGMWLVTALTVFFAADGVRPIASSLWPTGSFSAFRKMASKFFSA